ncbi:MAG: cytochrome c biogenesis protein ResB [Desulfarculaceae bacterium]|nr:cytochrome c biogenesis protein ResB [Desulfarculaceae bacterium]MCF8071271.1 cytochrome c biogenesis protein ResB [Desulfarculaceae bacterium]MCF8101126.1 cytochrome c biogenesis protein ResB [Desulfarculaceae bacterium]MCF8115325.1 cytochrome c biogenesis protein ResB [Desulfarculaceae bacterium]
MSADQPRKPILERAWDLFASVKLSFFLLLLLAVISIAGTLIPQKEPASVYVRAYGEAGWRLFNALGLDDMYHAPWFVLILALLAANLVICSLNRLSLTLRILGKDPADEAAAMRKPKQSLTLAGSPEANLPRVKKLLASLVGKVSTAQDEERTTLFAQRGGWSRFGVYLVHTSVLVIMAGGLVGNFWGYAGHVNIVQGQTISQIVLDNGQPKDLGFALRLDKFTVSFYKNGMPSEYRSEVTFLDQGKPVKTASLIVNDPAEYRSIDFYQASYGTSVKEVLANYIDPQGKSHQVTLLNQQWSPLPGGGQAGIMAFREKVQMGSMYSGPIARILYQKGQEQPQQLTAFAAGTKIPMKSGPVRFELIEAKAAPYSGLQVKYDPGVWLIWAGCTLMVLGFFMAFYFSHRKLWLRLSPTGQGRTRVELAASTNKNRHSLARLTARLAEQLSADQKTGE